MTYEEILGRMLDRVADDADKREGSIIYDALAPCAAELARLYMRLEEFLDECFADTAGREYLIKRAAERGLAPRPATHAVAAAKFNTEVPNGTRFSIDGVTYAVTAENTVVCKTAGTEGNRHFGRMLPIDYVDGLETAELTALLIPGEDEEDTEAFRSRYLTGLSTSAFGGNVTDYKEKTRSLDGVGGVKVYPVWNGGGTVRLAVISSEHTAPSAELVEAVQDAIDPTRDGRGIGIAPIGHTVTVEGVSPVTVNVSAAITYEDGWDYAACAEHIERAVEDYFAELRAEWADSDRLTVRISRIETRLLGCPGVVDIADTALNGVAANLTLGADEIPIRGDIIA